MCIYNIYIYIFFTQNTVYTFFYLNCERVKHTKSIFNYFISIISVYIDTDILNSMFGAFVWTYSAYN